MVHSPCRPATAATGLWPPELLSPWPPFPIRRSPGALRHQGYCILAARRVAAVALDYRAADLPGSTRGLESRMEPKLTVFCAASPFPKTRAGTFGSLVS